MSKTEFYFDGLDRLEKQLGQMIEQKFPKEFEQMVLDIASKLREKAIEKTEHVTGRLQDGWKLGKIKKIGNEYFIEIYNAVEYAECVEEGHRLKNGAFKEGAHMLELSLIEINEQLPIHLQKWINDFISSHDL